MFGATTFGAGPFGATGEVKNDAILTAPLPTLAASGHFDITLDVVAPSPTLVASGRNTYGEQAAILTAPSPTVAAATGGVAAGSAPSPLLSAAGTATIAALAVLSAPSPTLTSTVRVSAAASADLAGPSPNLIGYGGAVCSISLTNGPTLLASGTTGIYGNVALVAPLYELTASGTEQNYGSAVLVAPSPEMGRSAQAWLMAPSAQLTAIGSATVAVTYEAYALNLKHNPARGVEPVDEMTRYTNYPFERIVRYKNSYFGMTNNALYLLEGTTDDATPISWSFRTTLTDFDSVQLKTVGSAYIGGRFGADATITLHTSEAATDTYTYTTPRGSTAQNYRQTFGRGIRSRYFALGMSGADNLTVDTITFNIATLARKV